jgi:ABC-type branched-subunit amino acid transport system substrate-binding protein
MCVDDVNRAGGVNGHPIRLQLFDDKSDPAVAAASVSAIADSPAIAVLGHFGSTVCAAAGPGYLAARIPALTATATADAVTRDNPYYFRSMYIVSDQARQVAQYLDDVLYVPSVTLVYADNVLGKSYLEGFWVYQGKMRVLAYENTASDRQAAIQAVVAYLDAHSKQDSMIVLGMTDTDARGLILAMRRAGLTTPIMGHRDIGRAAFAAQFAREPEEQAHPGYFTDGIMAPTPIMLDSLGADGQDFVEEYRRRYGSDPDWVQASGYQAAEILVHALQQAHVQDTLASRRRDRDAVRDQLAALDSPENSVPGLAGPLFFDAQHNMDIPMHGDVQGPPVLLGAAADGPRGSPGGAGPGELGRVRPYS